MQEMKKTWVLSLGRENPMEEGMATHSGILAWKIPWTEEPDRLQSMGSQRVGQAERLHFHFSLSCIGEGNGNPLQCSCLENPRNRGAWWAAVYGVAQSWTRLTRLSRSSSSPHLGSWVAVPGNPAFAGPKLGYSGTLCAQNGQGSHACVPTAISQQ